MLILCVIILNKRKEILEAQKAIVLTQKNSVTFEEECFETCWGLEADVLEYSKASKFMSTLVREISERPNITVVCMEVPVEGVDISELETYIESHPEIAFYTYLEIKPLSFWQNYNQSEIEEIEDKYLNISKRLVNHINVNLFEFYNLEWIFLNDRNYEKTGTLNKEVSEVLLNSFINGSNMFSGEKSLYKDETDFRNEFENQLIGKTAVVFGSGTWDLNRGSSGMENLMEELSGLEIENLANNDSCAAMIEGNLSFFVKAANDYVNRNSTVSPDYIFIAYGLNDYLLQVPLDNEEDAYDFECYGGALRSGVEILKNEFPESEIIFLGPTLVLEPESGGLNVSKDFKLRDYEHVMEDVAKEFDIHFLNNLNTYDLHISKMSDYLQVDRMHLNEMGILVYVQRVLNKICNEEEMEDIKWFDKYFYIAHACGGIESKEYTNFMEAYERNYELGHRVFEIDFNFTSDDILVAVHDWGNETLYSVYGLEREAELNGVPLSSEDFLNLKVDNKYTTMSFVDVIELMRKYPDTYLVLDTKALDEETIRKQYQVIIEEIIKYGDLADRIIPQIYNQEMYQIIMEYYTWDTVIFTMYGILDWEPKRVVTFCEEQNIDVVATFRGRAEESFIQALKGQGQKIYMHTFNTKEEVEEMLKIGADGIYTDYLYPDMN